MLDIADRVEREGGAQQTDDSQRGEAEPVGQQPEPDVGRDQEVLLLEHRAPDDVYPGPGH